MLISYQCVVPRELIYLFHAAPVRHARAYNIFPYCVHFSYFNCFVTFIRLLLYFHYHLCHHHRYIIITSETCEQVPFRVWLN